MIFSCFNSAGVGRTGTFIALDYLYQQAKAEQFVDVNGCIRILREQRVNMVQTAVRPHTYVKIYLCTCTGMPATSKLIICRTAYITEDKNSFIAILAKDKFDRKYYKVVSFMLPPLNEKIHIM